MLHATSIWLGRNGKLTKLREMNSKVSLGYFYEALTEYVGLESNEPGKTMGLASYGTPFVHVDEFFIMKGGEISLKTPSNVDITKDFDEQNQVKKYWFDQFSKIIARPNDNKDLLSKKVGFPKEYIDLAASGQKILEDVVLNLVEWSINSTGIESVCIAGGVGLNCVMNGKILQNPKVKKLFIQPIAHDAGAALGAAISLCDNWGREFHDIYLGPKFSDDKIKANLDQFKLRYKRFNNIESKVASLLVDNYIVGWFQGRMEAGPRALGNRTILANPISPDAKDRINNNVKFRESWRPFALSILEEHKEDYLVGVANSPYMILSFDVPPDVQSKIPGVIHVDGSVRTQTVSRDTNSKYWEMINSFYQMTGVPGVINTSFNVKGEPIVCTPKDAVRTFFSCGLDYLAIGDYLVSKK